MAQVHDADEGTKEILGEKGTYAIDASGQTGEVCAYPHTGVPSRFLEVTTLSLLNAYNLNDVHKCMAGNLRQ